MYNDLEIQLVDSGNVHVSDKVKKLQEKICSLEASKDSEVINQMECHELEVTNSKTIRQLQEDIALLKVNHYCVYSTIIYSIFTGKILWLDGGFNLSLLCRKDNKHK